MSGNAHRNAPGTPTSVSQALKPAIAELPRPGDAATHATWIRPARFWNTVPAENFLAWNALRMTEVARLVLRTHVPNGRRAVLIVHAWVPALHLPALRCATCADSRWPCRPVIWAQDWIVRLPSVVEALEPPSRPAARVSTPVAVRDTQVLAVTWDTSSASGEEVPRRPSGRARWRSARHTPDAGLKQPSTRPQQRQPGPVRRSNVGPQAEVRQRASATSPAIQLGT
jgi:hypothetical protein